ncbi:MAG TPA: outer membrane lipid asymmetry maintenance protein MlaD [Stellaceae bacterium]|jgi:phospholipid/cholesterol/gamma-HCH transport system substrate-binding protein|nr:outer membrane lipid asymmetry maintenance protein MlaD [Stellaceae bacterium]
MTRNAVETVMGAVVLVVAAVFLFFAYTTSQVQAVSGYALTARFSNAGSLKTGGDVRISGIKVGSILTEALDPKTFQAVVTMSIDPSVKLSTDSVAQITSSGLLGDNYIAIEPGNEDEMIPAGGTITHTQAAMSLENLIGQVIYNQAQSGGAKKPDAGGAPASP